jgi:CRP-like cAMP-binding protein
MDNAPSKSRIINAAMRRNPGSRPDQRRQWTSLHRPRDQHAGVSATPAARSVFCRRSRRDRRISMSRSIMKPAVANRLLACLSQGRRQRLLAQCDKVDLAESTVLCEPGDQVRHVYFPIDSFISLITLVDAGSAFETGLVGSEGMQGLSLALGVAVAPQRALVQGSGSAFRMSAATFRRELAQNPPLRSVLNRYLHVLMCELAQTGACTRFHLIEARLARWLLMSHDRAPRDQIHLTHEFLAYMLGVRRVGITTAAGELKARNLISYTRGMITIRDRAGLEAASCACYRAGRDMYERMLGC